MYQVEDVIKFYLSKEGMSPKKLQKILYYAYSWVLTLMNESVDELDNKLFGEKFEAWVHGPVIPSVYRNFRNYGMGKIPQQPLTTSVFEEELEEILEDVWEVYGSYTGNELESITHQESPWRNARGNASPIERCTNEITDRDIFECYIQRVAKD